MSNSRTHSWLLWLISGIGIGTILGRLVCPKMPSGERANGVGEIATRQEELQSSGMNLQLDVLQRALDGKDSTIRKLEQKNSELILEYQRLQGQYDQVSLQIQDKERVSIFRVLEPILMQLPVITADVKAGANITPKDMLVLLQMIPSRLDSLGIEMVGEVDQITTFDPRLHVPIPSSLRAISLGEPVTVVVPGFRYRDEVLVKAEVKEGNTTNG